MNCVACTEPILPGEQSADRPDHHEECWFRLVVGSLGHQLGLCMCNGGPNKLDDPPDVSPRWAARLAMFYGSAKRATAIEGELMKRATKN